MGVPKSPTRQEVVGLARESSVQEMRQEVQELRQEVRLLHRTVENLVSSLQNSSTSSRHVQARVPVEATRAPAEAADVNLPTEVNTSGSVGATSQNEMADGHGKFKSPAKDGRSFTTIMNHIMTPTDLYHAYYEGCGGFPPLQTNLEHRKTWRTGDGDDNKRRRNTWSRMNVLIKEMVNAGKSDGLGDNEGCDDDQARENQRMEKIRKRVEEMQLSMESQSLSSISTFADRLAKSLKADRLAKSLKADRLAESIKDPRNAM